MTAKTMIDPSPSRILPEGAVFIRKKRKKSSFFVFCKFVNPLSQKSLGKSEKFFGVSGWEEVLALLDGG
ncbi:MAG: hypothetical protein SOZ51_01065 [Eubacteriales bacterium]|nr:hypothetical protein [Eubacteriales bacterium]